MLGRRRFLALMGVSTASAPLAAKAAMEGEQVALTQLAGDTPALRTASAEWDRRESATREKMGDYMRLMGRLPEHVEKNVRDRAKYVSHLDYDIASKRSWSLAAKVHEQQKRNYENSIASYTEMGMYQRAQKAFRDMFGFKWDEWD